MWHLEHWQVHKWVPHDQQSLTHVLPPSTHTHTHTHTHTLLDKVVVSLVSSPALQMAQAVMLPSFQQRYQAITVIVRGGEGGREGGKEGGREGGKRILGKKDSVIKYNFTQHRLLSSSQTSCVRV